MAKQKQSNEYPFFAMMARLKWIDRWALMRNSSKENLAEHSLEVAMLAHALCVIGNERFHRHLNADRASVIGMYHDVSEILTGDMPTPVKYFNDAIRGVYKNIEADANGRLLTLLPPELQPEFEGLLAPDDSFEQEKKLVKGADKLSAYIKCIEERNAGNTEFASAEASTLKALHKLELPEVEVFLKEFIPSYGRPIDELK